MDKEQKQQAIRELILKYTLPDALKPEYDGMTAWELAGIILKAIEVEGDREDIKNTDSNADRED